ncbi:hypothetical protein CBL_03186 [Carabus blaptoides fortunei]
MPHDKAFQRTVGERQQRVQSAAERGGHEFVRMHFPESQIVNDEYINNIVSMIYDHDYLLHRETEAQFRKKPVKSQSAWSQKEIKPTYRDITFEVAFSCVASVSRELDVTDGNVTARELPCPQSRHTQLVGNFNLLKLRALASNHRQPRPSHLTPPPLVQHRRHGAISSGLPGATTRRDVQLFGTQPPPFTETENRYP